MQVLKSVTLTIELEKKSNCGVQRPTHWIINPEKQERLRNYASTKVELSLALRRTSNGSIAAQPRRYLQKKTEKEKKEESGWSLASSEPDMRRGYERICSATETRKWLAEIVQNDHLYECERAT
ncbi:hypothetical protein WN51_07689 [Melipona quadrifasciata]|uniref:Uncharacterized protein n=1 Tax=Melipona quadrifasciata TaxID=166423 RepID=A0A0M9A8T6_9HYME|nr:hypothetical protein WN51_07689 [Melipona quadrifasciata]